MTKKIKQILSVLFTLTMISSILPPYAKAAGVPEPVASEMESITDEESAVESSASEKEAVHIITGFADFDISENALYYSHGNRPSLDELTAAMPDTLEVYLDADKEAVSIDVSWFCVGEDYETSRYYYFQFSPEWDEERYILADDIDLLTEAPYVGVYLQADNGISTYSVTGKENETIVYNFLKEELGLNDAASCGVLANIQVESNFSPTALNSNDTGGTKSYGICQWNSGESAGNRYGKLISWCEENGYDYTTLTGQLHFMKYELESDSYFRYSTLKNSTENSAEGASDAALTFAKFYEGCSSSSYETRQNLARDSYWPEYGTVTVAVPEITSVYSTVQTSVKVTWGQVSGASGYQLYRSTSKNGTYECVKTITSGSTVQYTNTGLKVGQTYYYKVRAYAEKSGSRVYSDFSQVRYMPAAVVWDNIYGNSTSRIRILWNTVSGAEGYQIWRADSKSGTYSIVKTISDGNTAAYSNTGLTSGKTYYYKIRAFITVNDQKVFGAYSSITAASSMPAAPALTVSSTDAGKVKLSWKQISGAAGYQIWRSDSENGTYTLIKSITDGSVVSYTNTGLTSGKTCYYKMRAYTEVDGKKTFGGYSSVKSIAVK